jgi:hypothetical protein
VPTLVIFVSEVCTVIEEEGLGTQGKYVGKMQEISL